MSALTTEAVPTRDELREHLVDALIAGEVRTTREDNLVKYGLLAGRVPKAMFGLEPAGRWNLDDVLDLMVEKVGVSPDRSHLRGQDRIDPDLTIDALDRMAEHLARAARDRSRVLLATGHPAGLLVVHMAAAAGLRAAGATVLTPGAGFEWKSTTRWGRVDRHVRYVGDVGVASSVGNLDHTHSPAPMRGVLAALAADGAGPPDLVMADHGWAGAAGQAGITSVGFADCNDPALFVGEAEAAVAVSVPLDDNVPPHRYAPMTAYLLRAAGLR
ncbi:MAG: phosphatase [Sporichthyaceae bacterium]